MSSLTNEKGQPGIQIDSLGDTLGFNSSGLMDASGERIGIVGCVWHPTVKTGTINIRKVHYRAGAVTFDASSQFRVSLQTLSATAGPPYQPDGTPDETYSYAVGTGPTASAWNSTGNLSADRVVDLSADSIGDANSRWLAVVFEYTTFSGTNSIVISALNPGAGPLQSLTASSSLLYNGTSWAAINTNQSIVALECDDGSYAFLQNCYPISAFTTTSVSSTAAVRRGGLKFRVPTERKIDRFALFLQVANGSDGRFVLYDSDGSTELVSVDVDNDSVRSTTARVAEVCFEPVTLSANTYYRFVFVGGTATSSVINHIDVNTAALLDGFVFGQDAHWTQHDGASWTDTTTRRPYFGLGFSAFHDGSGGAGGGGGLRVIGG